MQASPSAFLAIYAGWPERLYVIDEKGKLVYKGGMGPFEFHPEQVEAWVARRFPDVRPTSARAD